MMAQINLAPDVQFMAAARKRRQQLFLIAGVLGVLLLFIWLALLALRANSFNQLQKAEQELSAVEAELTRLGPDVARIEHFEARLASLDSLLDMHVRWVPLLSDLERLLPPTISLKRFEVTSDAHEAKLIGLTANLDEVAQTLASLISSTDRPTLFTSGHISSANRATVIVDGATVGNQIEFSAQLKVASPPAL